MQLHLVLYLCVAVCLTGGKTVAGKAPLVYFKASLPKNSDPMTWKPYPFGVGSIILFSSVEANNGRGYNPTSGVFHVPVSGHYQFRVLLQTVGTGHSDYVLLAQGSAKARIGIPKPWTSTSMSVVIHVNKGDHVLVKKTWENGNSPLRQGVWSQFSGFLLRRD
ncbi:heavy metal-binding protein HIP-like isoform X2 [Haliotis rufescens]|uniref:heavy metal-binding protein HIP-like isoform X2 n=1 Tax=Haliotis rufescens TaxID=6454 RepID=UPI00201EC469|nr:heavy metal-binding protein HIP-like isoform X2 [Haliotis rufescens]